MSGQGMLPSLETFAKGAFATVATLSTISVGLIYYGQNFLIYPSAFPPGSRTDVLKPSEFELEYQDLELRTSDDVTLRCYLLLQKKDVGYGGTWLDVPGSVSEDEFIASRPTVIMFHGNGGNLGHRIPLAGIFWRKMRCNVLMMCYRGYGHSEGSPSEKGIQKDAQAGLDYLISHPLLSRTRIILYGQSIGGAVSIDLASRNPTKVSALILENTFTSLPSLVPHALPILGPFSFLCHQKWDSINKIPLIPATTPILMLSGVKDEIVPKEHMRSLWEAIARRGEKRTVNGSVFKTGLERAKFMEFANGSHNDTCTQAGYWTRVGEFVASLDKLQSEKDEEEGPVPFKQTSSARRSSSTSFSNSS